MEPRKIVWTCDRCGCIVVKDRDDLECPVLCDKCRAMEDYLESDFIQALIENNRKVIESNGRKRKGS